MSRLMPLSCFARQGDDGRNRNNGLQRIEASSGSNQGKTNKTKPKSCVLSNEASQSQGRTNEVLEGHGHINEVQDSNAVVQARDDPSCSSRTVPLNEAVTEPTMPLTKNLAVPNVNEEGRSDNKNCLNIIRAL